MKYFTREWYLMTQRTGYYLCLYEDERAESYSEEFYQMLYDLKLKEAMEEPRRGRSEKEVKENLDRSLEENIERFNSIFPKNILDKIADMRVYVLNRASKEVIEAVTKYCKDNRRYSEKTVYENRERMRDVDYDYYEDLKANFHDCNVAGVKKEEDNFIINFDSSGGFTNMERLRFQNYRIIQWEGSLERCCWLYHELYRKEDKYELHVLLSGRGADEYINFTIQFEDVWYA